MFFSLLIDYIKVALDKKDDLYRKVIQITFNSISQRKVPTPLKILWIKKLYFLLQEEFAYYQEYEWIIFKSKEEYILGCDAASVIVLHDLLHGFPGDIHAQEQDKAKGKYIMYLDNDDMFSRDDIFTICYDEMEKNFKLEIALPLAYSKLKKVE